MIKSYTSLEQSKQLAEFLPLESADMWWNIDFTNYPSIEESIGLHKESKEDIPCWSLAALLDILHEPQLSGDKLGGEKMEWIVSVYPNCCRFDSSWHDNPVDACCEMIELLHQQKLL